MPRFLIELHHSSEYEGCARALGAIIEYGSHFTTNADWGCDDGVHTGWLIAELDTREEALQLVPPQQRSEARIVRLRSWTRDQIEEILRGLDSDTS